MATDLASSKKIDILEYNPSNVFGRARDWSKCVTSPNIHQLKLDYNIREYTRGDVSRFSNFIVHYDGSLRFKFNSRLESVLFSLQNKGHVLVFILLYQRTLKGEHPM